jgi:hypothetical protein
MAQSGDSAVPLLDWLRRQRRANELQLELMGERFDFDGAMQAGQLELAWWAMLRFVTAAARLYLYERGVSPGDGADWVTGTREMLAQLAQLDSRLSDDVWQVLLQPAPTAQQELARAATRGVELANERLQAGLVTREASIRNWANGVRLLREVASGLGIAGADEWYLREGDDSSAALTWYEEVMSQLGQRS